MGAVTHTLVVVDHSNAGETAPRDSAAIADEQQAQIPVATLIDYDPPRIACCSVRRAGRRVPAGVLGVRTA